MKIDYSAIVIKAQERTDALQRFEEALQVLTGIVTDSGEPHTIKALRQLQAAIDALDPEALSMLPWTPVKVLDAWAGNMLKMWAFVDEKSIGLHEQITPREAFYKLTEDTR